MSNQLFESVQVKKPSTNVFDLTHDVKLSMNMGYLIPVNVMEIIPGDNVQLSCESLVRFSPLVSPAMHRYDVYFHTFFVPNRIVWPNWEKFITNTMISDPPVPPAVPYLQLDQSNCGAGSLPNYMGAPVAPAAAIENVSALAFAAYQMIYNEYYRDENLIDEVNFELTDGFVGTNTDLLVLRRRAWEHDYFTSCLPFAQKGDPVTIPLGSQNVIVNPDRASGEYPTIRNNDGSLSIGGELAADATGGELFNSTLAINQYFDPNGTLVTEDSGESTTINDLRRAYRLQEWMEKQARGGNRYVESMLVHFGVRSSDARLNRPEYITGSKTPITISEVLNTSGTATEPQGNMAGHGVSYISGKYGRYYAEEHGYIITIMSVMPKTAYFQGLPKHFLKFTDLYQYAWPTFANLGEQPVLNKELYAFQGATGLDTFGYLPQYTEYKYMPSRVAGDFATTLTYWHSAREFASAPALNQAFIECNPDDRIFAITDENEDKLYCHVLNKIRAVRKLPKFGTPTF